MVVIITLDGPSGTGKSSVAKRLAERLGFTYVDTGAMYRAITYKLLQKQIPLEDNIAIERELTGLHYQIQNVQGQKRYWISGEDVTEAIRSAEVNQNVSAVSALPSVRRAMTALQRRCAEEESVVFEGRDMGSVVFPQADHKFFLTARPEVAAERRYKELAAKQPHLTPEAVQSDLQRRDALDAGRALAPLKPAADAELVDTSDMTLDQVVQVLLDRILAKGV